MSRQARSSEPSAGLALLAAPMLLLALLTSAPAAAFTEDVTRYVRYRTPDATVRYGVLEDEVIHELDGSFFESPRRTGRTVSLGHVELLAPVEPSKAIGIVANYQRPDREPVRPNPEEFARRLVTKLPSAISGPYDDIWLPSDAENLDWEGELVVVVGKTARDVSVQDAMAHVFGLTVGNDVSENDWFREQRLLGKSVDTWGPIGPHVVTGVDWNGLLVETRVNGELVQAQRTSEMIYSVPLLVSEISKYFTLLPGDLIFTGTVARAPGTPTRMRPGDVIEVRIEEIGSITNKVVTQRPVP